MSGPIRLDDIDKRLLRELQTDARQSNVALGRKVGLTEGAVRRRIDNLLTAGAFRIVAVGDPDRLGLTTHAVIGLRVDVNRLEQLTSELAAIRELSAVYETAGQYDVVVVGFFGSNHQLRNFLAHTLARLEGITDRDTLLIMRTIKRSYRWGEGLDDGDAAGSDPPNDHQVEDVAEAPRRDD